MTSLDHVSVSHVRVRDAMQAGILAASAEA
jgi:hypothetical protein